jgi:hypothetical protein
MNSVVNLTQFFANVRNRTTPVSELNTYPESGNDQFQLMCWEIAK